MWNLIVFGLVQFQMARKDYYVRNAYILFFIFLKSYKLILPLIPEELVNLSKSSNIFRKKYS